MSKLFSEALKLNPDTIVYLFDLDLSIFGAGVFRFTPELKDKEAQPLEWRGNSYLPMPVTAEGFELSSSGQFPRPKLTVSNVLGTLKSEMLQYNNLIGATVTRWRTFAKHLDTGSDPDPDVYFPVDIFKIDRKSNDTTMEIEFELASAIDQQGLLLPRRQILRNTCTHVYRVWDEEDEMFDYSRATCPYVGAENYDENGNVIGDPSLDECSKLVDTGCKKRFANQPLPTRAFPGVGRFR